MNIDLYANPNIILLRTLSFRNVWLGTLSASISTILSKYIIYRDKIEFRETEREYEDKDNIDMLLDYLHKQGDMWSNKERKEREINETIILLSKDKDISKVEKIVGDLTGVLNNVKNKNIKEPEKLRFYSNLFNESSENSSCTT